LLLYLFNNGNNIVNSSNINKLSKKKSFGKGANRGGILGNRVVLPEDYSPNNDEEFMNDKQLEFFRQKLTNWKLDLLDEATDTKDNLSAEGLQRPDIADRAQVESDASIQLRTRDRERKLISKIDAALRRIDLKTYGYCEDTGEPIGLGRLKARPIASLSVDAQERHEKMEKIHKEE
jgi:DnaK suppressor protein